MENDKYNLTFVLCTRGDQEMRGKVPLFTQFKCELHYFCARSSKLYADLKFVNLINVMNII